MSQFPIAGSVYKKVRPYFGGFSSYDIQGQLVLVKRVDNNPINEWRVWFSKIRPTGLQKEEYLLLKDFEHYFELSAKTPPNSTVIKQISIVNGELV